MAKLVVGGRRFAAALAGAGLTHRDGRVATKAGVEVWGVAPDEALLLVTDGAAPPDLEGTLRATGAHVTEMGAGLVAMRLAGGAVRALMEGVCPEDLAADVVADGAIVHTTIANVRATLARQDQHGAPAFTLLVPPDLSAYLAEALVEAGADRA
jgi:heterotetrameric sarcosine oxidase gamma subunit